MTVGLVKRAVLGVAVFLPVFGFALAGEGSWIIQSQSLVGSSATLQYCLVLVSASLVFLLDENLIHKHGGFLAGDSTNPSGYLDQAILVVGSAHFFATSEDTTSSIEQIFSPLCILQTSVVVSMSLLAVVEFTTQVWYPVGSGQCLMVLWDTFSFLFYFFTPLAILLGIAFNRHGDDLSIFGGFANYTSWIVKYFIPNLPDVEVIEYLVLSLSLVIGIGMPLLAQHSNIICCLFGKVYCHGQPNTNNYGILIKFHKSIEKKFGSVNGNKNVKLNVAVTLPDIIANGEAIKKLANFGHEIVISTNVWQGIGTLRELVAKYNKLLGYDPKWYYGEHGHRSLLNIYLCNMMGIKVAFWSFIFDPVYAEYSSQTLAPELMKSKGGDMILYFPSEEYEDEFAGMKVNPKVNTTDPTTTVLPMIVNCILKAGGKVATLSTVVKDDMVMELE